MRLALLLIFVAGCADEAPRTSVTITGTVRDAASSIVANVDVVFRGAAREETAKTGPDGKYRIVVPAGTYRAFVRDDTVMSVGKMDRARLPGLPNALAAGALDEALVPAITATRDAIDVDLFVVRGGVVTGTVFDFDARPVMGVVVSAHAENVPRPALGTDVAISRYDGTFEMRLPDGDYQLAMSHAQYADATDIGGVDVKGGTRHVSLTLVRGCMITGKVVGADGKSAGEGAIERRFGSSDLEFVPNGRTDANGTFRWTTTDDTEVVLRAWPWARAPSAGKRFNCRDGARFTTTFTVPERAPDLTGTLVDKRGAPVPFTHLDVQPLDPGGIAQQERTDALGRWAVFAMPPGRYMITANARGGVVAKTVAIPGFAEQLQLSGAGRIEGTTTNLVNGSFELALAACLDGTTINLPRDLRLVPVTNGRFVVDDVPACDLQFTIRSNLVGSQGGESLTMRATVPHAGVARVQVDIGLPREKHVVGVVRDREGHRVANAHVGALYRKQAAVSLTDDDGKFAIETFAGATISVDHQGARGETDVGLANVSSERVEIVLVK